MKKFIAVLVGAVITMSAMPMAFAAETTAVNDTIIGMPNPFIDYDTLEEAEKAAGFEISTSLAFLFHTLYRPVHKFLLQSIGFDLKMCIRDRSALHSPMLHIDKHQHIPAYGVNKNK